MALSLPARNSVTARGLPAIASRHHCSSSPESVGAARSPRRSAIAPGASPVLNISLKISFAAFVRIAPESTSATSSAICARPDLRRAGRHARRPQFAQQIVHDPVADRLRLPAELGRLLEEVAQFPVPHEHRGERVRQLVLFEKPALFRRRATPDIPRESAPSTPRPPAPASGPDRENTDSRAPFPSCAATASFRSGHRSRGSPARSSRRARRRAICRLISWAMPSRTKEIEFRFFSSTLVPSPVSPDGPDRDVGVAPQLALLHVAVGDAAVDHRRRGAR